MALVRHIYGRDITFRYIPIAGDEEFIAHSLVSARLYGPNTYPSSTQIADEGQVSTGHIGDRVVSWEVVNETGTGTPEFVITFPALTDQQPGSQNEFDLFYVALNYRLQDGGPDVFDPAPEQVVVYRPDGLTSKIRVSAPEVWALESRLRDLDINPPLWTEGKIDAAIEEMLERLEGRGYAKRKRFNLEKLNAAARRLACSYCCFDLISRAPEWEIKAEFWREQAEALFAIARVGYDSSGVDQPSTEEKVETGSKIWVK